MRKWFMMGDFHPVAGEDAECCWAILTQAGVPPGIDGDVNATSSKPGRIVEFRRGSAIYTPGEPADRLYVIVSGKVKIGLRADDGREKLMTILGPSETFGELSILAEPRMSSATAVTGVRALALSGAAARTCLAHRPEIAEWLLRVLARHVRRTNDNVVELVSTDAPGRVAKQLLRLARQFGTYEDGALLVTHDLTQDEIAQLASVSREGVNKALSEFTRRGWIRRAGKGVVIAQPERLARRAR